MYLYLFVFSDCHWTELPFRLHKQYCYSGNKKKIKKIPEINWYTIPRKSTATPLPPLIRTGHRIISNIIINVLIWASVETFKLMNANCGSSAALHYLFENIFIEPKWTRKSDMAIIYRVIQHQISIRLPQIPNLVFLFSHRISNGHSSVTLSEYLSIIYFSTLSKVFV